MAPHAHFVHCASHNLNLVLKDSVECNKEIAQFFETVQNVYNFFGHSILRWQELNSSSESETSTNKNKKVTLKTLNPTRWAGRHDAIYALKERFSDVMKALSFIILTSKKPNERNEAIGLKKKMESFNFILILVLQCKVLEKVNITSKSLQSESIDLTTAYDLLGNTLLELTELRQSFDKLVNEATEISAKWGIPSEFENKRNKQLKKHFDELAEDERLTDPKSWFRVSIFYPVVDTIFSQLDHRFRGMKAVLDTYRVIQPFFLATSTDGELRDEAIKFAESFPNDVSPSFPSQISLVRSSFRSNLKKMRDGDVKQLANFLIIQHSSLVSTYPDVCTACLMYLTVPVTVAKAERSFSKLKLIKNFLRSTMSQERLSGLALLSIENDRAQKINFDKIVDIFSDAKSRKKLL